MGVQKRASRSSPSHRHSPILQDLEKKASIKIVGAMYDLATGIVEFVG
jgi:carbonic anhydrase